MSSSSTKGFPTACLPPTTRRAPGWHWPTWPSSSRRARAIEGFCDQGGAFVNRGELVRPPMVGLVAEIGLVFRPGGRGHDRLPGDPAVELELDDMVGHLVVPHLVVVHPHGEDVANAGQHHVAGRLAQHA